ncbi:MAG: efflux RND transporter periplasmic adaptor subunit [Candidatus Eisenbacteria bacterium]|uniref:Efflux RND transporter periplasmic adaptor subunit n=1 Tax=Eiseniibacteriota bacterium TaxID=2212470 RepID=A0A849SJ52_UNCEI|nr:efflux RND transporter periplasmic adaptor subunit [Candidatus Eisenbacteria bacterium]
MTSRLSIPIAALFAGLLLTSCGHGGSSSSGVDAATPLRLSDADLASAELIELTAGVPVSGTLQPAVDVNITAPLTEVIESVPVREGQSVARGAVLARFRTGTLAPAAASARAALEMSRADHERYENLYKAGAVAKREVEAALANWRSAEAQAAHANKQLEESVVRAPVSGVVSQRFVEAGDRPADGDPMFHVVNTSELDFEATVPSETALRVRPGSTVRLSVSGWSGAPIEGKVARVNAAVDPATRQLKIYVRVPNANGKLVGGLYASGAVVTERVERALAVPLAAVRGDGDSLWVMTVANGTLARHAVRTGVRDEAQDRVEIVSGLAAGARVVIGPLGGLIPGARVTLSGVGGDAADSNAAQPAGPAAAGGH